MLTTAFIHRTPTLPLPHTQLNQYQLDLLSGLANNCSITTLYVLYATTLWKDPYLVLHVNQQDKPSGFLPRYGRYEVFSSAFPTHLDRVIVITSHLSLPALPHNTTPSEKEEHSLRCSWPMNSPMKPPHRLILSVPRVLDAFCKTWDWPASESSASSGSPIS